MQRLRLCPGTKSSADFALAVSLCKRDYVGVAQQIIEQLIDEELDKRAFIEILIRRILHNELSELKNRALLQGAKDAGAI